MFDNIEVNMMMIKFLIHCTDDDNKVDVDGKTQDNSSHGKSPSQT